MSKLNDLSINEYIQKIPEDHKEHYLSLYQTIRDHISEGFEEQISYGVPSWVIPLEIYPSGYQCRKDEPLPFISLMAQKNYLSFSHMGMYANQELFNWFSDEFLRRTGKKADMGKSCLRIKYNQIIPDDLIAELLGKMSVDEWIELYESKFKR